MFSPSFPVKVLHPRHFQGLRELTLAIRPNACPTASSPWEVHRSQALRHAAMAGALGAPVLEKPQLAADFGDHLQVGVSIIGDPQ